MSTREAQQQIVANMKKWQKIENAAVTSTGAVMEKTENPVIRLVMEIIQRDSNMHHRIQETIANSIENTVVTVTPDDLAGVWDLIERHIEIEKSTIEMARASLGAIEGKKGMAVQAYFLEYLLRDEEKHDFLLENLASIKKGMYPYG